MDAPKTPLRRVSVVGSTGTGKTTFGRELARIMGVPFVELDALNWGPNWTMIPPERFQALTSEAISPAAWVVDGNYGGRGVRELVWAKADTIIWFDFGLGVIFRRLWQRTTLRIRDGAELWPGTGNRETIRGAFFSRESLFWWALKTHRARRRNYARLLALPQYADRTVLRFTRPADADRWLMGQVLRVARR
ncbi:MAG: AAA family ATPase [Candidatus Limnocylindria bacterium]|nr:AAA family ATPase [Candidatus Limnocylindria bacterium]